MLTILFYVFFLGYTYLLTLLFGIGLDSFTSPWTYLLIIVALIISYVAAFASILGLLSLVGEFRKKKPYDNKFNHFYANSLLRLALHIGRIKVIVTGKENIPKDKVYAFVCNHQENYDIPILMPIFPMINFIAKESLFKVPILGKWIGLLGNIPIGKMADREAAKSIINGIKMLKSGIPMGIFPEGKRSRSQEMLEFKPGALKLAMKPKADILVGTIFNVNNVYKKFSLRRYKVYVHIHELLPYESYKDLNSIDLADKLKKQIQGKINEFEKALS